VAVKIPRKGVLDAAETEKFLRDARATAQLRHPHIVGVHEVGREQDTVYIVSDYIKGANLREWLTGQRLSPRESAELLVKIAEAVHHAHQAGVVHRDIKASNLMLATSGCVKVMDFGIARCLASADRATRQGYMVGTMQYMSPEQVRGTATDARADVYSLGVLLYELLTGELPFDSENDYELCRAQIEEPPRPPRSLVPELSEALEAVVLRALAKDPGDRFPDVLELREALQRATLHPAPPRVSADRDAPVTRELALEDAEQIALASTRNFTGSGTRPVATTPPSRTEFPVPEPEPSTPPASRTRTRSRGRIAATICALVAFAVLCGVKLVRFETRAPSTPPTEARPAVPVPVRPAALSAAAPAKESVPAEIDSPLTSRRAADEKSDAKRGEGGWVIRRR
jgi:serine/threonine-protein kinase